MNPPASLNLPDFDTFEVFTQGDDGAILRVLRSLAAILPADNPMLAETKVLIAAFEKRALTVVIRSCDTRKRGCKKLPDGTLEFPGPVNHMASPYSDYLQAAKSWADIKRYITDAEYKFKEDQRRVDTLGE